MAARKPNKKAASGPKAKLKPKPKPKPKPKRKPKVKAQPQPTIRAGATRIEVFNSGLEVWIYDEANAEAIRARDLWTKLIGGAATDGQLVGYSLWQDDGLRIDVVVGAPLTVKELSVAHWLEPQHALLRAPSGKLAVESNDSCRVAEDWEDRTDAGGRVQVPAGNYRLTLHRIDREALDRERRTWEGAEEVIVLTPGGTPADDVAGLLPFRQATDLSWVAKLEIDGSTARGLVWFEDYWDTYFANLDSAAVKRLGLQPGSYLRTTVPATGHTFVTVFAKSWTEGAKLRPPAGPKLEEFGYGAIVVAQRWEPHEGLFCRRVKASRVVDDHHKTVWHEAFFEVLDAQPATSPLDSVEGALFVGASRIYKAATLADRDYFDDDELALCMKLDGRIESASFDEPLALDQAVRELDAVMAELGLKVLGDFCFALPAHDGPREFTVRTWIGPRDLFASAWASIDTFEVFFFSRLGSGRWLLTGTIDRDDAERISAARPRMAMQGEDDVPLAALLTLHRTRLEEAEGPAEPVPAVLPELVRLYDDYLVAAVD